MKKFLAVLLCTMMVCAYATNAMAAPISGTLTSTTELRNVTSAVESEGYYWTAAFTGAASNKRVVARVHAGYDAASATWVYSGYSTTSHPYVDEYADGWAMVTLRARVDNRDQGPITISGTFTP